MNVTITLSLDEILVAKMKKLQKGWKETSRSKTYQRVLFVGLRKLVMDAREKKE